MKIKSLRLENFKRFTDLTLLDIPDNAKLVLLIGSNGSGKSSVFDSFEVLNRKNSLIHLNKYDEYYSKNGKPAKVVADFGNNFISDTDIQINYGNDLKVVLNRYYGRTSFRQIPKLTRTQLGTSFDILTDSDKSESFIDRDLRFENDLEHVLGQLLKEFFNSTDEKLEIKKNVIAPINEAFNRIFQKENGTKIELVELIPPLEGKVSQINFKKGESVFHYNQLSAGEKEIFNILLNLVTRKKLIGEIVYFDEIDLHLNTRLQYGLLKEIVENWIPDNCQFWTASHSLGFIQYAKDYAAGCIFDLDDLDFDKKQVLEPQAKNNFEIFEIAVSKTFIDEVVQGRKIIFSENTDTSFFNDLNINQTLFFVALDKMDVFHKAKNLNQFGLIDRDYLSDNEIENLKNDYPNLFILPYYSFENLLYHPENLEEYYNGAKIEFDKYNYIKQLIEIKNRERDYISAGIIQARAGYPFYKENENAPKLKAFKENYKEVIDLLRSDDLETFYKVFPAKDYGKTIPERQKLSIQNLAKTNWFKTQIQNIIQ